MTIDNISPESIYTTDTEDGETHKSPDCENLPNVG